MLRAVFQPSLTMNKNFKKCIATAIVVASICGVLGYFNVTEYFFQNNIVTIGKRLNSFGAIPPLAYIGLYMMATLLLLPGLPMTMFSGLAFGPVWGIVYTSIGSTIGMSCAFVIGRYLARNIVEEWIKGNPQLQRIDEGVSKQGWKILMITRLVPIFPFNIQNYVYGLTKIKFVTFLLVSWICMLPGTAAYVQLGAAVHIDKGNTGKTWLYLAGIGIGIILMSLAPSLIHKRQQKKTGNKLTDLA